MRHTKRQGGNSKFGHNFVVLWPSLVAGLELIWFSSTLTIVVFVWDLQQCQCSIYASTFYSQILFVLFSILRSNRHKSLSTHDSTGKRFALCQAVFVTETGSTWSYFIVHKFQYKYEVACYWIVEWSREEGTIYCENYDKIDSSSRLLLPVERREGNTL